LFGSSQSLDEGFAEALLTADSGTRRAVTKGQDDIRRALRNGEQVRAIAVDQSSYSDTIVVAGRRVLVMRRGGRTLLRAFDAAELDGCSAEIVGADRIVLTVHGAGARITVRDIASADTLVSLVNDLILACRPRSVPVLNPTFYTTTLAAAGVPATPTNRVELAGRTAAAIGMQAGALTAQLRDPEAFAEFVNRFAMGGPPDRKMELADDMIDWLWAWHPGCHKGLVRQVDKWRTGLLRPGSFLTAAAGGEIPPWNEPGSPADNTDVWRTVFEANWK
jgi:hypothetical protein